MRIIFLSDVAGSGLAGEVKEVRNGYARNYLLPKKLATLATHDQLQRLVAIRRVGEERRLKEEQEMQTLVAKLSEVTLNLFARIGPTGRFYGAITTAHVAEELHRLTERAFDRRFIHIDKPIQEPGDYQAEIRLPQGSSATVKLAVMGRDAQGRVIGPDGEITAPQNPPDPAPAPAEESAGVPSDAGETEG